MVTLVHRALQDRGSLQRRIQTVLPARQTSILAQQLRPQRTRAHLAPRGQRHQREVTLQVIVFAMPIISLTMVLMGGRARGVLRMQRRLREVTPKATVFATPGITRMVENVQNARLIRIVLRVKARPAQLEPPLWPVPSS